MSVINYLTTVRFGEGSTAEIGDDLRELGISRAFVITDRGVEHAGLVERALVNVARDLIADIYTDTPSNPTEQAAEAALTRFRASGADGIIAIGGGSPIDLAKAVALMATHDGPFERFAARLGGIPLISAAVAPVIAVPTTAGTGSEVGRAALVTLQDGRKLGFISPHLIPKRAICDPELTYGLPPLLTAATGIDAISHCVETYLSPRDNPPAEAIALDGLRRAVTHIETAVAEPEHITARREMMMAALQGGLTFQKGLGAIHAISHPAGGLDQPALHHGMLNAVLMPHVLRFNESAAPAKYDALRNALELPPDGDVAGYFDQLNVTLELPRSLSAMGLPREAIPQVVEGALNDHSAATNPRTLTRDHVEDLVKAAY
ncbi:iron-containing alcohol dehydrogenase [Phytoactinopolyspora alkaliphila]|uniref:Iron-containing alcohol dehydrogenase n=1 Tax=Phytoactinopolyspora alkaliphila TaxID=1783498 RepID=A0A6N9YHR8_9ACTN|nr:iron-containing alcohol dehydrogenase [Phytoactinopolyspora alkaliphila]